jgi:hypothetical protein
MLPRVLNKARKGSLPFNARPDDSPDDPLLEAELDACLQIIRPLFKEMQRLRHSGKLDRASVAADKLKHQLRTIADSELLKSQLFRLRNKGAQEMLDVFQEVQPFYHDYGNRLVDDFLHISG